MTIEKIIKTEKIRTKKQISVVFVLLPFLWLLWQWSRIDDIICQIFLSIVTIVFGYFVVSILDLHYDQKIDNCFKAGE